MNLTQVEIDQDALQAQIDSDPVIATLKKRIELWREKEKEKKARWNEEIRKTKREIGELNQQIVAIQMKIRHKRGYIGKCEAYRRSRIKGSDKLEGKIAGRKTVLKNQALRKAALDAARQAARNLRII